MARGADTLAGDDAQGQLIGVKALGPGTRFAGGMKRTVILMLAAACGAIGAAARAESADVTSRGRLLAQRYCATCHAIDRQGRSPNAAAPPFRDLHARYRVDDLAEALAEGILVGHPAMPEMRFPPDDVRAILAYIKSIQGREQATLDAGAPPPAR
jgi:mono/diheme cytochrome c family protein